MHCSFRQTLRLVVVMLIFIFFLTSAPCLTSGQAADGDVLPALVAGKEHTAVLRADGTVWTWGDNSYGQLGNGTLQSSSRPQKVIDLDDVVALAAGDYHILALQADGTVWAWGDNSHFQLGMVRDQEDPDTFIRTKPEAVRYLNQVTDIAAGAYHSLALRADGTVRAWGDNTYGQIGDGTMLQTRESPRQATFVNTAEAICANGFNSAALMENGTVRTWGANWYGQLGDDRSGGIRNRSVQVEGLTDVISIAVGNEHMLAVKEDGTVWAWGNNASGQLGNGTHINRKQPVQVSNIEDAVAVAAGEQHSIALTAEGTVWTWGNNNYSQLGNGTTLERTVPVLLHDLQSIAQIAAGFDHSVALAENGTIWGWGSNWSGYLGDGTTEQRDRPVYALLNAYFSPFRIPVSGILLSSEQLVLQAGSDATALKAYILPEYASDHGMDWISSDPAVAAVVDGMVKPLTAGTAEIVATTRDGDITAVCAVTVRENDVTPDAPASPATEPVQKLAPTVVWVNDIPFTLDNHFMEADRQMVPLRFLSTALGAAISWDGNSGEALLTINDTQTLRLAAGRNEIRFDREDAVMLELPPRLVAGRIFVPLRAFANLIGAEVEWQAKRNSIHIYYEGKKEDV